jgi:Flp pilus assembly protein TadD
MPQVSLTSDAPRSSDTGMLMRQRDGQRLGLAAVLTMILVVISYWPSMHGPFLFDSHSEIVRNLAIRTLWPPTTPMFEGGKLAHRPIPYYTFALNYAVCGVEPFGWHVVNVAIHLVNGLLAWYVLRSLLQLLERQPTPGHSVKADWVAWVVVTVWLVHPLCTQAVSYVYQRIEALSATSMLAAAACFLASHGSPHRMGWRVASVASVAIGMLCKESAAAAPLVLFLMAWLACPENSRSAQVRASPGWRSLGPTLRADWGYWSMLAATWTVAGWLVWLQYDRFGELTRPLWTPWEYALQQPRSILRYLQLAVWPVDQCIDYGWSPTVMIRLLPGWIAVVILIVVAVWSVGRAPGLALSLGSFVALLGPTSSLLPVVDLCVEHRMYLPLLPLTAAMVVGSSAWLEGRAARLAWGAAIAAVAITLTVVTHRRNVVYTSAEALWGDAFAKAPDNPRPAIDLAAAHLVGGRYENAALVASAALDRQPAPIVQAVLLTWLARARIGMGERSPEVLSLLDKAVKADPNFAEAHFERGSLLTPVNPSAAAQSYAVTLAIDPDHANACNNLAGLLMTDDPGNAVELMRRAVAAAPDRVQFRLNLARVLRAAGRMTESREVCLEALSMPCTAAEHAGLQQLLHDAPPSRGPSASSR